MSVNRNAQTASQANEIAVHDTKACIDNIHAIPRTHRSWITRNITQLNAVTNLHNNNRTAAVVEVNTSIESVRDNGGRYHLTCMLDVDIPPASSSQAPHFGWEVKADGMRVGNGHVWLPKGVLAVGRPPPPGAQLDSYGYGGGFKEEEINGNAKITMECTFRRYK